MAGKDLNKIRGPIRPTEPGLKLGTKTTPAKAPTLEPRWGVNAAAESAAKLAATPLGQQQSQPAVKPSSHNTNAGLSSERTRARMVERLARQGIRNQRVLDAMHRVPRHRFVDEALASRAYEDTALPIGQHQTISQPYVVARVIEIALDLLGARDHSVDLPTERLSTRLIKKPTDQRTERPIKALELGCGCGYQAAVMSYCFDRVVTVERIKALVELARVNLKPLKRSNVRIMFGDGLVEAAAEAPFDVILFSAGMATLPQEILGLLAPGGVLVAPIGEPEQHLTAVQIALPQEDSQVQQTIIKTFDMVRYVPVIRGTE
ncbi:MAG: protein-L-isoaspartate O-methyltransferase [Burkholderiaceae bacterium]